MHTQNIFKKLFLTLCFTGFRQWLFCPSFQYHPSQPPGSAEGKATAVGAWNVTWRFGTAIDTGNIAVHTGTRQTGRPVDVLPNPEPSGK